jgi:hypothetical protein
LEFQWHLWNSHIVMKVRKSATPAADDQYNWNAAHRI